MPKRLLEKLKAVESLPIEITELRDHIIEIGVQDRIIICIEDMDPRILRGMLYQYSHRPILYGEIEQVSLIVVSEHMSPEWKRLVCAKEMVHILDGPSEQTNTPEDVMGLIEKLLGPLSTEDVSHTDYMALVDRIALYKGLALLFPDRARDWALTELSAGRKEIGDIASVVKIPEEFVSDVLDEAWPDMMKAFFEINSRADA